MQDKYIIREFNESFGQIVVEYRDQKIAIDLPIKDDNTYPVGEELDATIRSMLPIWHYERIDRIASGVSNKAEIAALVVPYPEPVIEPTITIEATNTPNEPQ